MNGVIYSILQRLRRIFVSCPLLLTGAVLPKWGDHLGINEEASYEAQISGIYLQR